MERTGHYQILMLKYEWRIAMDIITTDMRSDLDVIRHIRNGFAHSIPHHSFGLPALASSCKDLWIFTQPLNSSIPSVILDDILKSAFGGKALYIMAISLYHWRLITSFPRSATPNSLRAAFT